MTRLALFIAGARDLAAADRSGKSDPYVRVLSHGNRLAKTKVVKQDLNPTWNELFVFSELDGDLVIEVWDRDLIGADDFLGYATLCASVQQLEPNVVVKQSVRLVARSAADAGVIKGEVFIAFVAHNRPDGFKLDLKRDVFAYRKRMFKVGDLVLFAGAGPISLAVKATTSSEWTHAGLVVALPNVFTGVHELFLLELTQWSRLPGRRGYRGSGVRLFDIEERIHESAAYSVALCARETPLPEGAGANLNRVVCELWMRANAVDINALPVSDSPAASLRETHKHRHAHEEGVGDESLVNSLLSALDDTIKVALKDIDSCKNAEKSPELLDVSLKLIVEVLAKSNVSPTYAKLAESSFVTVAQLVNADAAYAAPQIIRIEAASAKRLPAGSHPFRHGEKPTDAHGTHTPAAPQKLTSHPSLTVDHAPPDPERRHSEMLPGYDRVPPIPRLNPAANHHYAPAPAFDMPRSPRLGHSTPPPPRSPRLVQPASTSAPPLTMTATSWRNDDYEHLPSYETVMDPSK
jgi:hypothetical protein